MQALHYRIAVRGKDGKEEKGCLKTACGRHGTAHFASYDPRDIDCLVCRKTKRYKKSMGINNK
jgi:hypothetical protein